MGNFVSDVSTLKGKLDNFYRGMKTFQSKLNAIVTPIGAVGSLASHTLSLFDIPTPAKFMMFRLVGVDGVIGKMPDLILPINPDTFSIARKKKSDLVYTTGGFVTQHWHEDKITIDANGWVPSFQGRAKILTEGYAAYTQLLNLYIKCGSVQNIFNKRLLTVGADKKGFLKQYTDPAPPPKMSDYPGADDPRNVSPEYEAALKKYATSQHAKEIEVNMNPVMYSAVQLIYQHEIYEGIFTSFTEKEEYQYPNTLYYSFKFLADPQKHTDSVLGNLKGVGKVASILRPFASADLGIKIG